MFALSCQELGVRVRYIRPRRPEQNGKVERSHRIDEEEFRGRYAGQDFDAAHAALAAWEHQYNHERFSMALHGRTPMEKLAAMLAPPLVMARSPDSVPVSEHALLTCQGGRAQRTGEQQHGVNIGA